MHIINLNHPKPHFMIYIPFCYKNVDHKFKPHFVEKNIFLSNAGGGGSRS